MRLNADSSCCLPANRIQSFGSIFNDPQRSHWLCPDQLRNNIILELEDYLADDWEVQPKQYTYKLTLDDIEWAYNKHHADDLDFEGGGKAFAAWIRRHCRAEEIK